MNHREQAIIYAVIFTIWLVRLYYKLYDKETKRYVMEIGLLIVFWMFIRIIKSVIEIPSLVRICWYLYYLPLLFIPVILYICAKRIEKNKWIYLSVASILLLLVLTNDFHELVFKFNNGLLDYDNYKHNVGYYVICIWIFYFLGSSMISLAKARLKIKKDYKVFLPILLLLVGLIYTILYVIGIPFIASSNMACILSVIICIGIELILYLDLIPNNKKYKDAFVNSSLEMGIVSLDGNIIYNTKEFNVPEFIINDIKSNKIKSRYKHDNLIYDTKKNKGSFVVLKKDITILNNLQKELESKQEKLLKQRKELKKEKKYKQKLNEINLRNEIILKIEKDIIRRKEKALNILDKDNITKNELEYVKLIIAYAKRKSSLVISEVDGDYFDENSVSLIIKELLLDYKSFGIHGEIKVDKLNIDSYKMSLLYEIIFSVLENLTDLNVMIFICCDSIKIIVDKKVNIKSNINVKNIIINENTYDSDTEIIIREVK